MFLQCRVLTYLYHKTHQEIESCHGNEQHLKVHVVEVVQFEYSPEERTRIQHQRGHHGKVDQQQAEEDHWKEEQSFKNTVRKNNKVKEVETINFLCLIIPELLC